MKTAVVFGAGLIGMSFAVRFAEHGWKVRVVDNRPEVANEVKEKLGENGEFFQDLEKALDGVDIVQEAGPEKIEFKQDVFKQFAKFAPEHCIFASCSSALLPSKIAEGNPAADRILIGHPFTPPAILPVLEVVPGEKTSKETMDRAMEIYTEIGFDPTRLKKEIPGFIGNRIQKVITWEAIYLVQQGVIDIEDFDRIVRNSAGLRYAAVGPFESNRLGGGADGVRKLYESIFAAWIDTMPHQEPDMSKVDEVIAKIDEAYGKDKETFEKRMETRDNKMRGFLKVIEEVNGKAKK